VIDSIKRLAVTATFSLVEDRTTVDRHDFTDVFYVLDLYHSWNSAQGGLTQNQQQHSYTKACVHVMAFAILNQSINQYS